MATLKCKPFAAVEVGANFKTASQSNGAPSEDTLLKIKALTLINKSKVNAIFIDGDNRGKLALIEGGAAVFTA